MPTALHANSKRDTRFLCDNQAGTVAGLAVDESQYATNLTNAGTYVYEDTGSRFEAFFRETVEMRFAFDKANSGTLLFNGLSDLSQWNYWITVDTSGVLSVSLLSGAYVLTAQLDASGLHEYILYFAFGGLMEGGTWGVWGIDTASWIAGGNSAFTAGNNFEIFSIGAAGYGTDTYSLGAETIAWVRCSSRYHSREECYLDWIGTTTPDTQTGITRTPAILPSSGIGVKGVFAGPGLLAGGSTVYHHDRRLVGPLLDVRMDSQDVPTNWHGGGVYGPSSWLRAAPKAGGTAYKMSIAQTWWRPVPPTVTHGRVRAHFAHWKNLALTPNISIFLRMYSMNRLPTLAGIVLDPPPPPLESFYVEYEDTQSGSSPIAGIWLDLGILKLARGGTPYGTYFALALSIDEGGMSSGWDAQNWSVKHIAIDALTVPAGEDDYWGQGGLDEEAP